MNDTAKKKVKIQWKNTQAHYPLIQMPPSGQTRHASPLWWILATWYWKGMYIPWRIYTFQYRCLCQIMKSQEAFFFFVYQCPQGSYQTVHSCWSYPHVPNKVTCNIGMTVEAVVTHGIEMYSMTCNSTRLMSCSHRILAAYKYQSTKDSIKSKCKMALHRHLSHQETKCDGTSGLLRNTKVIYALSVLPPPTDCLSCPLFVLVCLLISHLPGTPVPLSPD